jgi:glycosyltransferase involved in cell wall biosynthesis
VSATLVSIGIPTRNRAASLERAVRSALAQQWDELEIIVSDNASTDGTAALCDELAAADPRVRYVRHASDIGAEANFQSVLEAAGGAFFMWLADDDWIDAEYVAACATWLDQHPDHIVVCGRGRYYRGGEQVFVERPVNLLSTSGAARLLGFYRTVALNGPYYGVIRREPLLGLPKQAGAGNDWLLVAALAYSGLIRTLEGVSIHRSVEGTSVDESSLARAYGLSRRQARHWYLVVALAASRDVRTALVYDGLGRARRNLLAAACASLVVIRFGPKTIAARGLAHLGLFTRARSALERRRR